MSISAFSPGERWDLPVLQLRGEVGGPWVGHPGSGEGVPPAPPCRWTCRGATFMGLSVGQTQRSGREAEELLGSSEWGGTTPPPPSEQYRTELGCVFGEPEPRLSVHVLTCVTLTNVVQGRVAVRADGAGRGKFAARQLRNCVPCVGSVGLARLAWNLGAL